VELLTTKQAAERLGISEGRVRTLIIAGRLPAEKFGKAHMIREQDLKLVSDRKPGRPAKAKQESKKARVKQKRS
jgi:excisionase family DNA binding protein